MSYRMRGGLRDVRHKWDFWLLAIVLLIVNLPVLFGGSTDNLSFFPSLVRQGQWWLIPISQFAHITRYHLLLDGVPFLLVYCTLDEKMPFRRLLYVFAAGMGSILAASLFFPYIETYGLRGLSGITYGIMAVSASEMIAVRDNDRRIIGVSVFVLLLGLITYELFTGRFPLEFLLFNMVGKPVLVCHAGGVAGALAAFILLRIPKMQLK